MAGDEVINIICIHGFGGFPEDWTDLVAELPATNGIFLNIPPEASSLQEVTMYFADKIAALNLKEFYLAAYSMGGRIGILLAQELAKRNLLQKSKGLILLSAGLGFKTKEEILSRESSDQKWADLLITDAKQFWKDWYSQDLFKNFKINISDDYFSKKKRHSASALMQQLLQFSPAKHEFLFPILNEMPVPLLYLVGAEDKKYLEVAYFLKDNLRGAEIQIIPDSGHSLLFENPKACAKVLADWINRGKNEKKYRP